MVFAAADGAGSAGSADEILEELFADGRDGGDLVPESNGAPAKEDPHQEPEEDNFEFVESGNSKRPGILPDPGQPTESQKEDHCARGHVDFRSWCPWCVKGRATGEKHLRGAEKSSTPVFVFDYLFLTEECERIEREDLEEDMRNVAVKVLVAKDVKGKAIFAHAVPQKGVDDARYASDTLAEDVKWLGYHKLVLRSDNEKAIVKLLHTTLLELHLESEDMDQIQESHPARYDSAGNGEAESAVKTVQGLMRTNKLAMEAKLGAKIPAAHPLVSWMAEYCAWVHTVHVSGADGITAHHRVRERPCTKRQLAFCERIMYKIPPKAPERTALDKLGDRWPYAVFLGYSTNSSEYWVFDAKREHPVVLARSLQRLPTPERWST